MSKKQGKGKKILTGFAVLALIAIAVMVIIISIPPNTDNALSLLNKATTNSFMVSETEKQKFDTFEKNVDDCVAVNNYIDQMPIEMANVQTLSKTVSQVTQFYNRYIIFAQNKTKINKYYKDIKNGINNAFASQSKLNKILNNAEKITDSPTQLQVLWIEFREEYVEWLENYNKVIGAMSLAYQNSMGNTTTNNLASTLILNTVSDFVDVIYNDFVEIAQNSSNPQSTSYEYDLQGKIKAFDQFVKVYLVNDFLIKNYYFDSSIKESFDKVNLYFKVYSEEDMKNAISSIELVGSYPVVKKTYEGVEDNENVYSAVKSFLQGGV